jgi:preprotein translocase subunit YajC
MQPNGCFSLMKIGDRVLHKSGNKGTVIRISNPWIFVALDGMNVGIPYSESSLKVIEEE